MDWLVEGFTVFGFQAQIHLLRVLIRWAFDGTKSLCALLYGSLETKLRLPHHLAVRYRECVL
jgi:hypothetical protein